jgi:hypothetical protein
MNSQAFMSKNESQPGDVALVVTLETLNRTSHLDAGGKAANLGELINAGFAVPPGFCVTTAAYALVSAQSQLQASLSELEDISQEEGARQYASPREEFSMVFAKAAIGDKSLVISPHIDRFDRPHTQLLLS